MDPKNNPANILDRESLKPGGVETCKCKEIQMEMLHMVKKQKAAYLEHILCGEKYVVPKLIITGKQGRRLEIMPHSAINFF